MTFSAFAISASFLLEYPKNKISSIHELVRTHENLISDCIKVMSRIKAIYRSQAIKCAGTAVYQASKRDEWLGKLTEPGLRFRAELFFRELDTLIDLRKQARLEMLQQARRHKDFKRLCQIPGLGFVSVSRLIAQVGTPFRFQTKRQFWKYCGLAVTTRSSADNQIIDGKLQKKIKKTQTRGLSHHFCHRLKNVFKMAAKKSVYSEAFGQYYEISARQRNTSGFSAGFISQKNSRHCLIGLEKSNRFRCQAVGGSKLISILKFKQFRTSSKLKK